MEKIRCCVIDDEPLAARLIAGYIDRIPFLTNAGTFASAQDAIKKVIDRQIDLIYLDINMPQLNGLEFARIVPAGTRVIFTTAYDNYAVESFKVNALDYLLKPISFDEFSKSALKALDTFTAPVTSASQQPRSIIVKSEYKLVQIPVDDILYIEALKDYVRIRTKDTSVMTLLNIKAIEQALPDDIFMRVHRSFIVNKHHITVIERNRLIFGNVQIPISDSYRQAFTEFVNSRLIGTLPRTVDPMV